MKKILILFGILSVVGFFGLVSFHIMQAIADIDSEPVYVSQPTVEPAVTDPQPDRQTEKEPSYIKPEGDYEIYVDGELYERFETYEEAVAFGKIHKNALLKQRGKVKPLWDNYPPYNVFTDSDAYTEFKTFAEAVAYGKQQPKAYIYYRKNNSLIWTNEEELKASAKIENVPWISQMPQLPRGCEVTSLAMLLNYKGIPIDKMILADEIKKNQTPYRVEKGVIYAGSPYNGFVGDMKNLTNHGLGVYHGPIHELLSAYLPDSALDLTGAEFEDLFYFINHGTPVWVIINTGYQKLPSSYFERWQTEDGELNITYKEHSVLITGYDTQYIYFNDPLSGANNRALKSNFADAWVQMGSQAVTIAP